MRYHAAFPRADCPAGSQYYTCSSSGFKGCCKVDACTDAKNGCPADDLVAASGTTATSAAEPTTSVVVSVVTVTPTTKEDPATTSTTPTSSPESTIQPLTLTTTTTSPTTTRHGTTTSSSPNYVTVTTATTTTATPVSAPEFHKKGLSAGAIGGISAAAALALIFGAILTCLYLRRRRRRRSASADPMLQTGNSDNNDGNENNNNNPSAPDPSMTPGTLADKAAFFVDHNGSPVPASAAEMSATPLVAKTLLYGELDGGGSGRWGPYMNMNNNASSGGYSELDGRVARAELETPLTTPQTTPLVGAAASPNLSITSSGGASTLRSQWRASAMTAVASNTSTASTDQLQLADQLAGQPQHRGTLLSSPTLGADGQPQPQSQSQSQSQAQLGRYVSVTGSPRPNLDVSRDERVRGQHVASWGIFQGFQG